MERSPDARSRTVVRLSVGVAALIAAIAFAGAPVPPTPRPMTWAQPVPVAGVPNLHRIDESLYRSAQPTREGLLGVVGLGVRTVVNLRSGHSDSKLLEGTNLHHLDVPLHAWHVEDAEVVRVLKVVTDPAGAPYLLHCQHGADRTGLISAMYRLVVQRWSREEAIRELVAGGYGYHPIWKNLTDYLATVDVDKIRRMVAATQPPSAAAPLATGPGAPRR
jgi:protein tyrosine/serine phosphatase